MRKIFLALLPVFLTGLGITPVAVNAAPMAEAALQSEITRNEVVLNFPDTATFQFAVNHPVDVTSVVLEYGNQQQTCGVVVAKAFPQVAPGKSVHAEWTWEMAQGGSLPPGAQLWWRWRFTDANGNETVTDMQTATWLDVVHNWKTVTNGDFLRLHYYEGSQGFIDTLSRSAAEGLKFNQEQSGLKAEDPIDIYIYANTDDLREAILYEPSWVGGQAYPDQDIVIIGISENNLGWGKTTIVHELTHVLVGHLTFTCLGDVPTWLNEGLAMYSEGGLDQASQAQLDGAILNDTLLSVRSLNGGFSEASDKASLSYSESYSLVKFLIDGHGQEKMTGLLVALREGMTPDEALQQTYGFNVEGLEDAWRAAVKAQPRADSGQPVVQPTPTFVPTIVPISVDSNPGSLQVTPTPIPTSSSEGQESSTVAPQQNRPSLALTLTLLALCCIILLLVGIVVLGFFVRRQNSKGGNDVP